MLSSYWFPLQATRLCYPLTQLPQSSRECSSTMSHRGGGYSRKRGGGGPNRGGGRGRGGRGGGGRGGRPAGLSGRDIGMFYAEKSKEKKKEKEKNEVSFC